MLLFRYGMLLWLGFDLKTRTWYALPNTLMLKIAAEAGAATKRTTMNDNTITVTATREAHHGAHVCLKNKPCA